MRIQFSFWVLKDIICKTGNLIFQQINETFFNTKGQSFIGKSRAEIGLIIDIWKQEDASHNLYCHGITAHYNCLFRRGEV
jgi:hypothetical protein